MKVLKKLFLLIVITLSLTLCGCVLNMESITITNGDMQIINVGETVQLEVTKTAGVTDPITWLASGECVSVDANGVIYGLKEGIASVSASANNYSDVIQIQVVDPNKVTINLIVTQNTMAVSDTLKLDVIVNPEERKNEVVYNIISGNEYASINGNLLTAKNVGEVEISASVGMVVSNIVSIKIEEILTDPYASMSKIEFYNNYEEATSYMDAYYRSLHGFMSGSIDDQDQEPTISEYQPMENGVYLKNSFGYYSEDGNTYLVVNAYGEIVNTIYKGGGYVTLEDVAAYVFAFGDIPANYTSKKSGNPANSPWGEYLRLNHSNFSGNTSKYPYEPKLPNISGCGGDLEYYEIDLGTTGTDCDPSYDVVEYNDGYDITRGAARIVYSRFDKNGDKIIDISEKYLFYTYNHYNDFQEYLNYEGGWGEMFGNITGGGSLSSKYDYNPTPYVPTILKDFTKGTLNLSDEMEEEVNRKTVWYIDYKKKEEFVFVN